MNVEKRFSVDKETLRVLTLRENITFDENATSLSLSLCALAVIHFLEQGVIPSSHKGEVYLLACEDSSEFVLSHKDGRFSEEVAVARDLYYKLLDKYPNRVNYVPVPVVSPDYKVVKAGLDSLYPPMGVHSHCIDRFD